MSALEAAASAAVLGLVFIVAGVARFSVGAALIVAGALLLVLAVGLVRGLLGAK